jgi:hypothetical protein
MRSAHRANTKGGLHMFKKIIAASIFSLLVSQSALSAPSDVRVKSINYAGSGCPAGSVSGKLGRDFTSFTLYTHDFLAQIGYRIPLIEKRKNCQLTVDLLVPSGWSYTIAEVEYKGYVSLDRGVTATQSSAYYFQGSALTARVTSNMRGPLNAEYNIKDTLGISAQVWSPCGAVRALNINAQVLLQSTNRNASGIITLDRIKGNVETIYGLRWKRC